MDQEISGISRNELLTWLAEGGSKTLGYDAILAYDRATVNKIFREQYIRRFHSGSYYPEISDVQRLPGEEFVFFERCILSEPWITFEGADITSTIPSAKVSMQVLGGNEIKVRQGSGQRDVVEIRQVNALNASVLESFIPIKKVNENGLVGGIAIDLKEGVEYTLSQRNTHLESQLGGMFFRDRINEWGSDKTQFKLNDIKSNQGPLAIQDFTLRIQPAPGAGIRNAANYGDGAVLAFLDMPGGQVGTPPTNAAQLKYLVPNDNPAPYTATTIIQARRVLITIVERLLENGVLLDSDTQYIPDHTPLGGVRFYNVKIIINAQPVMTGNRQYNVVSERRLKDSYTDPHVRIEMVRTSQFEHSVRLTVEAYSIHWLLDVFRFPSGDLEYQGYAHAKVDSRFDFGFKVSDGKTISIERRSAVIEKVGVDGEDWKSTTVPWNSFAFSQTLAYDRAIRESLETIFRHVPGFDLFILNSFLFSEPLSTYMQEVVTPYDTAIFGHITADHLTKFELVTPLHTMAPATQHTFLLTEPQAGITWSAVNLPGESGPVGQIHPETGVYTAPAAAQIPGLQKRVLISAVRGQFMASGLLTVVRKSININPLVQWSAVPNLPEHLETRGLNAGALNGNAITWGTVDPARGGLEVSNDGKRDMYFHPPTRVQEGVAVDVVPITVTAAGQTETAYVLVKHLDISLTVMQGPIVDGVVTLTAELASGQRIDVEWAVIGGAGTIDPVTGVLTSDVNSAEPFALVTATLSFNGYELRGYRLFGMPLIERTPPAAAASRHISLC